MSKSKPTVKELVLEVLGAEPLCTTEIHDLIQAKGKQCTAAAVSQALTDLTDGMKVRWKEGLTRSETAKRKGIIRYYTLISAKKKVAPPIITVEQPPAVSQNGNGKHPKQIAYNQPSLPLYEPSASITNYVTPSHKKITLDQLKAIFANADLVWVKGEDKPLPAKQCLYQDEIILVGDRYHYYLKQESVNSILLTEDAIVIDVDKVQEVISLHFYLSASPFVLNSMTKKGQPPQVVGLTEKNPMSSIGQILSTFN